MGLKYSISLQIFAMSVEWAWKFHANFIVLNLVKLQIVTAYGLQTWQIQMVSIFFFCLGDITYI